MKRGAALVSAPAAPRPSKLVKIAVTDSASTTAKRAPKYTLPKSYALLATMYEGLDMAVSRHQRLGMSPNLESLKPSVEMVCQRSLLSFRFFCLGSCFCCVASSTFLAQHVAQILTIDPEIFILEWRITSKGSQLLIRVRFQIQIQIPAILYLSACLKSPQESGSRYLLPNGAPASA
jgi:hypothetical protein